MMIYATIGLWFLAVQVCALGWYKLLKGHLMPDLIRCKNRVTAFVIIQSILWPIGVFMMCLAIYDGVIKREK